MILVKILKIWLINLTVHLSFVVLSFETTMLFNYQIAHRYTYVLPININFSIFIEWINIEEIGSLPSLLQLCIMLLLCVTHTHTHTYIYVFSTYVENTFMSFLFNADHETMTMNYYFIFLCYSILGLILLHFFNCCIFISLFL